MRNTKEWFSANELTKYEGLPNSPQGINKKARTNNWLKRERDGVQGGAVEYHYSSLPAEAQRKLGFDPDVNIINKPKNHYRIEEQQNIVDKFEFIPYYAIRASAGYGAFTDGLAKPSRYLAFAKEWVNRKGLKKNDLAMISAVGDSMEPAIYDGDVLLIDKGNRVPRDGKIYVIRIDDQLWVKRIQGLVGGMRLISDNKALYDAIDIDFNKNTNIEIIGQVVYVGHDLI